jgi:hypothetical protein
MPACTMLDTVSCVQVISIYDFPGVTYSSFVFLVTTHYNLGRNVSGGGGNLAGKF